MRLTRKKIEEILTNILGERGIPLIQELIGKENISEFDLADTLKIDIKEVRKLLYVLYNHNLVSFTRKKDKTKGWYIYYWTLQPESVRFSYYKMKKRQLELLERQLQQEEQELFFVCPNKCTRLTFDHAMDYEFHCPECGELLTQDSTKEKIAALQKQAKELQEEIATMEEKRQAKRRKVAKRNAATKEKTKAKRKTAAKKKVTKKKAVKKKTSSKKKVTKKKAVKKKAVKKKTTRKKTVKRKKVTKKKK